MSRQKLGQHFLGDQDILQRIASEACPKGEPVVVEIGPGKGALTEHLLRRALHVAAIELDRELASGLVSRFPALELVIGDALQVDLNRWPGAPVTGNLPYCVATPIIARVVRYRRPAVFLIQKEVAERIAAKPGSRDYGYFSLDTQFFAEATVLFPVSPDAFRPPPKVESAVIRLTPRAEQPFPDPEAFLQFVSLAFRHKRKTLRNNLGRVYGMERMAAQPEANERAETLSMAQFAELFRRLVP
jgi:16S rRNA (adenine1518-N6/adenine1519-N6)-dimethyltransferase